MKTTIKILSIIIFIKLLTSCTDLKEEIFDTLTKDNYYQDKNSIIAALTRPYNHAEWCGWVDSRWIAQELTADHFIWAQKGKHGYDGGDWIRLHGHQWTDQDNTVYNCWTGPYAGVSQCNLYLDDFRKLDYSSFGLTESDKIQHISELRTLRVWFYLFLIDFFREIPIVEDINTLQPQSTPNEVFKYLEKELKEALPGLPKNGSSGRISQGAAAALLVRLYLNAEVWIGTPKYSECAKVASDIISGVYGTYSIDPDYTGPFRSGINGYRSPENIFEFPHAKNYNEMWWMYGCMNHYQSNIILDTDWGGWNGISLSPSRDLEGNIYNYKLGLPYEKYAASDKRKQPFRTTSVDAKYDGFFLIGQQYEFNRTKGFGFDSTKMVLGTEEYNGKPLIFVDQVGRFSEKPEGRWKEGSNVSTGEENTGVRLIKFPWLPMSNNIYQYNSATEIRLAEIYYALAECKFRSGDKAGAAVLLDNVRKRNFNNADWSSQSYVQNPGLLNEDEFVDELGREFIGEHRRRTDLIRWGRFGKEWWAKPADLNDKTVFPIPTRVLNSNPLLKPTKWNSN